MTESKHPTEGGAASSTEPSAEAPASTPALPEGADSATGAAGAGTPAEGVPAPASSGDAGAAGTADPSLAEGAGAAADPDATLIAPPAPVDPEATLEAPAAPPHAGDAAESAATDAAPADAPADGPPVLAPVGTDAPAAEGAPSTEPARVDTLPAPPPGGALRGDRINLVAASGQSMAVGVRTPLGKHIVRRFGEESNVWDTEQCVVERGPDGSWQIVPGEGTTNETLLNGEAITGPRPLHDGDVIAGGRVEKGIVRLALTVRGG